MVHKRAVGRFSRPELFLLFSFKSQSSAAAPAMNACREQPYQNGRRQFATAEQQHSSRSQARCQQNGAMNKGKVRKGEGALLGVQ